jgi:hypothetical protein
MKAFVKRVARSAGYEIRKVEPAACSNPVGVPPQDEVVPGPWQGHVLEMANRNHRPKVLQYHRSKFGDDQRQKYILNFLDLRDMRTLEPGPLEGDLSIILEKLGVRENIAFESRLENLQKCQRIKEIYGLNRTTFLLGNLEDFYNGTKLPQFAGRFDLVLCLGVLYHVPDPGKALAWFRSQAKTLFLGTHFPLPDFPSGAVYTYNGKSYRVMEYREGGIQDPISGMSPISLQPYEADLLNLLRDVGYDQISVLGRDLQNRSPHITILAE